MNDYEYCVHQNKKKKNFSWLFGDELKKYLFDLKKQKLSHWIKNKIKM